MYPPRPSTTHCCSNQWFLCFSFLEGLFSPLFMPSSILSPTNKTLKLMKQKSANTLIKPRLVQLSETPSVLTFTKVDLENASHSLLDQRKIITLTNITGNNVVFKIRVTSPQHYLITPVHGTIESKGSATIKIIVQFSDQMEKNHDKLQILAFDAGSNPPDSLLAHQYIWKSVDPTNMQDDIIITLKVAPKKIASLIKSGRYHDFQRRGILQFDVEIEILTDDNSSKLNHRKENKFLDDVDISNKKINFLNTFAQLTTPRSTGPDSPFQSPRLALQTSPRYEVSPFSRLTQGPSLIISQSAQSPQDYRLKYEQILRAFEDQQRNLLQLKQTKTQMTIELNKLIQGNQVTTTNEVANALSVSWAMVVVFMSFLMGYLIKD